MRAGVLSYLMYHRDVNAVYANAPKLGAKSVRHRSVVDSLPDDILRRPRFRTQLRTVRAQNRTYNLAHGSREFSVQEGIP